MRTVHCNSRLRICTRIADAGPRVSRFAEDGTVPLQAALPPEPPRTTKEVLLCERAYAILSTWLWLSFRFADAFPGREHVQVRRRWGVCIALQSGMGLRSSRHCNSNSVGTWLRKGPMCALIGRLVQAAEKRLSEMVCEGLLLLGRPEADDSASAEEAGDANDAFTQMLSFGSRPSDHPLVSTQARPVDLTQDAASRVPHGIGQRHAPELRPGKAGQEKRPASRLQTSLTKPRKRKSERRGCKRMQGAPIAKSVSTRAGKEQAPQVQQLSNRGKRGKQGR
jgi:Mitochondrial degradasome RNA helicase subunit C terminal